MLDRVRTLIGLSEVTEQIIEVVNTSTSIIKSYCNIQDDIPEELKWVVVEVAIARYNRIGSEGIKSESVDGVSSSYETDFLTPYKGFLDNYNMIHSSNTLPKVKML